MKGFFIRNFAFSYLEQNRLRGAIKVTRGTLQAKEAVLGARDTAARAHVKVARERVDDAEAAMENGDIHESWALLHAARRKMLHLATEDELECEREGLLARAEASGKLSPWRSACIQELLAEEDDKGGRLSGKDLEKRRSRVIRAARIRDEHYANTYYKIYQLRGQSIIIGLLTMVIIGAILWAGKRHFGGDVEALDPRRLFFVLLFGMLGASCTVILSFWSVELKTRITERVGNTIVTFTRPLLGAAAALGVYMILHAGFLSLEPEKLSFPAMLTIAFVSGFSERYLMSAVTKVSGGENGGGGGGGKKKPAK